RPESFKMVCNGIQNVGPFEEHILGYWKSSLDNSHKILFLKYEDLKEDTHFYKNISHNCALIKLYKNIE
ncbi:hypothetical protein Dsin_028085, partial [Dipteronia sinensis]